MVQHWKWSEPGDRVNIDRYMPICGRCHHYRKCVASKSYCPPYSLAIRWHAPTHTQELILEEVKEAKDAGWTIEDFCKICNHRCRIKSIERIYERFDLFLDLNYKYNTKPCAAFNFVLNNIPCPIRKLERLPDPRHRRTRS